MENLNHPVFKIYNSVLQLSILVFTAALVYFSFVYYPGIINQYKSGKIPVSKGVIAPVVAKAEKFPIETAAFRIVREEAANVYFVYVNGETLDKFVINKSGADLTLKSVLSMESICNLDVRYSSTAKLEVPQKYLVVDSCK